MLCFTDPHFFWSSQVPADNHLFRIMWVMNKFQLDQDVSPGKEKQVRLGGAGPGGAASLLGLGWAKPKRETGCHVQGGLRGLL